MIKNIDSDLESQIATRKERVANLRSSGQNPYPNFTISCLLRHLPADDSYYPAQAQISESQERYRIAGRLIQFNDIGKIKFLFIQGDNGILFQGMIKKSETNMDDMALCKIIQLGDFVGFSGPLFLTSQGKRAIFIEKLTLVSKSIRPLPAKTMQQEITNEALLSEKRYVDFIQNPSKMDVFVMRAQIISCIRRLMDEDHFLEVETRTLLETNGGASAKPFTTHHNALGKQLNLRIATELDLKRAVISGMERVYELNKVWRNEGIDKNHNPEFTTLEFYQSYATYQDHINFVQHLLLELCHDLFGRDKEIDFGKYVIDFGVDSYLVSSMLDLVLAKHPDLPEEKRFGKALVEIFENEIADSLIQPTFVTNFPVEVSPLARRNDADPRFTDRFELYVAGMEIANGFSELNDPQDQRARFENQLAEKAGGNQETMDYDEDFCTAMEYGMPPCAGTGIGIDRLVMLLTNQTTIRNVILFPR